MRRMLAVTLALALAGGAATPAWASPVTARLSVRGLEWLEAQVPALVPRRLTPPPMTFTMYACDGADATFTQRDTVVDLTLDRFELSVPAAGILRVDLTVSLAAAGQAVLDRLYACHGYEICDDEVTIDGARAIVDLAPSVDPEGRLRVAVRQVDLQLDEEDVDARFSNCSPDEMMNWALDAARKAAVEFALIVAESVAEDHVGPRLEGLLTSFMRYDGKIGRSDFTARVTAVDVAGTGVSLHGDLDLASRFPAAACIAADPGQPPTPSGSAPRFGDEPHLAVAVNLGVLDDVLYHLWREGMMCVTSETLRELGVDFELHHVGELLPGFPEGTRFALALDVAQAPRVEGTEGGPGAGLTLHVRGVRADLFAAMPDGGTRRVHLELDASGAVRAQLDPAINALTIEVDAVRLERFVVENEVGLEEKGFDYAKVRALLEDFVLPGALAELRQVPVTGPVFGPVVETYAILRALRSNRAWAAAEVDLFRAPANDRAAPETEIVTRPQGPVRPAEARVVLGGRDGEVPTELLRYRVSVDGAPAGVPTYVQLVRVGMIGRTSSHRIHARAVDLAGNEDSTAAVAEVTVDGVRPRLTVHTQLRGELADATPRLAWEASDDLTAAERLVPRLDIARLARGGGMAEAEPVSDRELAAGARETVLEGLEGGQTYRVILGVRDEAGNVASETLVFRTPGGAGCGCRAGGTGAPAVLTPGVLALAGLLVARRRQRPATRPLASLAPAGTAPPDRWHRPPPPMARRPPLQPHAVAASAGEGRSGAESRRKGGRLDGLARRRGP